MVLTRLAHGYCEAHAQEASGFSRFKSVQKTAEERGYGSRWKKLREQILRRDNGLCQPCMRVNRVAMAAAVDHIIGKAKWKRLHGGSLAGVDSPDNLQSICKACHKEKSLAEAQEERKAR